MSDPASNPDLLRSLGKLARGLSALFWGLPAALVISVETVRAGTLNPLGITPALIANVLLLYGLLQMTAFQKQERPWRNALDRAKLLAIVNVGLCPFLFWFNRMPEQPFFRSAIGVFVFSALLFIFNLNVVLKQLGDMLPDEALRNETRQFTAINRGLLITWMVMVAASLLLVQFVDLAAVLGQAKLIWLARAETVLLLFLGLSPFAITMALIWKTKQVIFDSVFGAH